MTLTGPMHFTKEFPVRSIFKQPLIISIVMPTCVDQIKTLSKAIAKEQKEIIK